MRTIAEYVRHRVYVDVLAGELWIAEDADGELYLPIRPTCAALDLDSIPTLQRIKADSRLASGLRKIRLPSGRGDQEQQCLASTEYAWWLALIDPRRFSPVRRDLLAERQRVLMGLAKEIMLKRQQLRTIPPGGKPSPVAPQFIQAPATDVRGQMEGTFHCLRCGAPHLLVIDGAGWHLHLGVEVD